MREQQTTTTLTEDGCWELLAQQSIGRVATAVDGRPDIVPTAYTVEDRVIYVRTTRSGGLAGLAAGAPVAFEADRLGFDVLESVVVRGTAEVLQRGSDRTMAEATGVVTFARGHEDVWVRITPSEVAGRHLNR